MLRRRPSATERFGEPARKRQRGGEEEKTGKRQEGDGREGERERKRKRGQPAED